MRDSAPGFSQQQTEVLYALRSQTELNLTSVSLNMYKMLASLSLSFLICKMGTFTPESVF